MLKGNLERAIRVGSGDLKTVREAKTYVKSYGISFRVTHLAASLGTQAVT